MNTISIVPMAPTLATAIDCSGAMSCVLSVGAILLLMRLLRDLPAARVNSLFYLVPPLAVLESWLLFGERLSAASLAGLALCVAGVALAAAVPRPAARVGGS